MKRFLLSLVLVFLTSISVFGQRDTDHWIAPMMDRASSSGQQVLYFSTDSVTPFPVQIYNNNVVIGTVTISKGSPQTFPITNRSQIITTSTADCFTPKPMGFYMKGTKPFFVTLRFSVTSHAEIITSKGKAGIGTTFYAANAPITQTSTIYNFTTGIMATEDATTVTVSGYNTNVAFSSGPTPTPATLTFTLDKGQSYIIEGSGSNATNSTGFIGAKIVSNKPVSVTNGNMNGQFAITTSFSGSDIVMDQSVPVNRLGDEFVLVKGNGNIGQGMEGALIIATENNTQIFINGSTTPAATINEGQSYRINDDMWINQLTSGHYNMHIKTSKNAYVYQLLAGVSTSNATLGYNYVPPLNCFLPRKIDEIGKINEMPGIAPDVKLNILTEAGAVVTVSTNGGAPTTPTAAQGPFPVTGTANWVSYSIPSITGNVTVQSSKAVTAGVIGGSGVYGYGGYFAGFSSIPVIAKQTGDCIPGIILEVDDSYESYQWNLNGAPITGATSNTFTPAVAGDYTVKVTMGTCPPVTTPIFKVFTCLQQTTQTIYICGTKVITPTFTNSSQSPVANTVTIVTQPTHGTATINPSTGVITYIPQAGYLGADVIVYKFCGNAPQFVDCEQITLNLNLVPFVLTDRTIYACQYAGKGYFDLTTANVTDNSVPTTKKFYPTLADLNANTNQISNPTNFFSGAGSVYVRVTTSEGCVGNAKITLDFFPTPVVNEATLTVCFIENNETKGQFDLTTAVITNETPVTKKYYPTFTDASNGTNEIMSPLPTVYISENGFVYARVYNANNCYAIAKINLKVTPPKRSTTLVDKFICIDDRTTLDAGSGFQSYQWSTGATTQTIQGVPVGSYWVILQNEGCYIKQTVNVKKANEPVITSIEISNNTATINVEAGTAPYKYAVDTPTNWQDSNIFTNLSRGQHTFYVKDALDCTPVSVELTVPNLVNAITPNGDNVNDVLDYSELAYKGNLTFVIYDRYGNKLFTGDRSNNYKWDGRASGKGILTGTYWYHINWIEPNVQKTPIKYTGWILVKNRE